MDQYINEMAEPTDEQQRTNSLEAKCLSNADSEASQEDEFIIHCESCGSDKDVHLYNIHGQQLHDNLSFGEVFNTDCFLCKDCHQEKYPKHWRYK